MYFGVFFGGDIKRENENIPIFHIPIKIYEWVRDTLYKM